MPLKNIRNTSFFRHLSPTELKRILSIAKTERIAAGRVIFSKDDAGNAFFIVKSGMVKIYTATPANRTKTLAYLGPGDFFGEMALLGGRSRSASACAQENCELLVITKSNFNRLLKSDGEFTLQLLHTLSQRLRQADEEIEALLFHNMLGRLAGAIVKLARERKSAAQPLKIAISIQELSEYVGTTREPLSRSLSVLKRIGLLDYENRVITVMDLDRLTRIAPQHI